jgi:predicted DNA-binding protein
MTTSIRMPVDLHRRLQAIGDHEYRSVNNLLVMWIRELVERYEREHPEIDRQEPER